MDVAHRLRRRRVNLQPFVRPAVAVGSVAAHPATLRLAGVDFVTEAGANHSRLVVRHHGHHIHRELPLGRMRFDGLGRADERHVVGGKLLHQSRKVTEVTAEAVELVDHHAIHLARPHLLAQHMELSALNRRPAHRRIHKGTRKHPAVLLVPADAIHAQVKLGIQRIVLLIKPLSDRLAGINHAAAARGRRLAVCMRRRKRRHARDFIGRLKKALPLLR